jgi:glucose/arabinose dehydrogenase
VELGEPWGTFDTPVHIEHHPVNGLVYVVEQAGVVQRATADGTVLSPPAIDLRNQVRSGGEQGLLGLAFDAAGDRAFVNFTNRNGDTVVASVGLNDDGTFEASSRRELLRLEQPYPNHNGGEVLLGPDGGLWVPTGDGGSAGDPERVALDPTSRLGKLLRIDPDTGEVQIWASGLRNPWRASFDPVTDDLWIADVGQGDWEEISVALARQQWARGLNFGWSAFEGTHRFHDDQPTQGHVAPVFDYAHGDQGCSITGGVRYRGSALGDLWGAYVFSDFCSGRIRALPVDEAGDVGEPVDLAQLDRVVAIRADRQGELWVVSLDGDVRPLVSAGPP